MKYKLNETFVISPHDSGAILLDTNSGEYFEVNETAYEIIELIVSKNDKKENIENLSKKYKVSKDELSESYKNILKQIIDKEIVLQIE